MGLQRIPLRVKICGLTTPEAVEAAAEEGADYFGFIFYSLSPRNLDAQKAARISASVPADKQKVAVFVDPALDDIKAVLDQFQANYIQLHGRESPEFVSRVKAQFGLPVIKAIAVAKADDLDVAKTYAGADMLLFDTKTAAAFGGTGQSFDWNLLAGRTFPLPWFLSGGISAQNVLEALDITKAKYVDVSSSLERERGIKDPAKIVAFLTLLEGRRK